MMSEGNVLETEVSELKMKVSNLEVRMAVAESTIKDIASKLDKIEGGVNKVMWILITAIILAILNSVLKGGVIS